RLEQLQFAGDDADGTRAVHHFGDRAAATHLADILAEIADGDAAIGRTLASSGGSLPAIMRNSVVLPAPLGPTRPVFSPFCSAADASMKRIWWPTCLETLSRRIIAAWKEMRVGAFSSEVDTGSPEENALNQESRASVLIQSEPKL